MELVTLPEEITRDLSSGSCVTIGNFDGVHKGHRKLIDTVVQKARRDDLASVVITFDPHPLRVLVGDHTPPFITVAKRKIELIESLGPDVAMQMRFNRALADLTPEEFVRKYLVDGLNIKALVVGYDYSFGKGRSGNFEMLKSLGEKYGFSARRLDPVIVDGAIVSSTRIRDLIKSGEVWNASSLLGRLYRVSGEVIHGMDRGGKLLGFPTANLRIHNELHPATGVYAVWAELNGVFHQAVANIGYNPTFGNDDLSVEVHILDFDADIYGSQLSVHFVQRLRPEKKFDGLDALKEGIRADTALARRLLDEPEARP